VKAVMVAAYPVDQQAAVIAALALESEPLNVLAQALAYREMLLRQRINEGAAACMLSHSTGDDLDNIAANLDTERLIKTEATETTDAEMESDEALRLRAQAAFEGMSVAGPSGAYEYFTRSASGKVADARASSPE
ncbi:baseplate J/gp47 family protein, partial [Klebsiella pneumoniae]|nr:baseplate J/gp47 family protein [Klebsiella pneumoniae]